jgi:hypothetical protein
VPQQMWRTIYGEGRQGKTEKGEGGEGRRSGGLPSHSFPPRTGAALGAIWVATPRDGVLPCRLSATPAGQRRQPLVGALLGGPAPRQSESGEQHCLHRQVQPREMNKTAARPLVPDNSAWLTGVKSGSSRGRRHSRSQARFHSSPLFSCSAPREGYDSRNVLESPTRWSCP